LVLDCLDPTTEDLQNVLAGLGNLRSLRIHHNGFFWRPPVLGTLPDSLERLHLETTDCIHETDEFNQLLAVIGTLPNLVELVLETPVECDFGESDWLGLLPAASRFTKLRIYFPSFDKETFCALLLETKEPRVWISLTGVAKPMICFGTFPSFHHLKP